MAYVDGRRSGAAGTGGKRRPAAGQNRGLGGGGQAKIAISRQGCGLRGRTYRRAGTGNPAAERRDDLCL